MGQVMVLYEEEWVLGCISQGIVYDFYKTKEKAEEMLETANSKHENRKYEVMSFTEFDKRSKEYALNVPELKISEEKFKEKFEILPPLAYSNSGNFETFLMGEPEFGPITYQYYRRGTEYFCKMVNARDKSTWVKA